MPSPLKAQTLADRIGARVEYRGQNVRKFHMFSNGSSPLVTDIFSTLEEGVIRFGARIEIKDKVLKFSTPFQRGYKDAGTHAFYVRDIADAQERHEYGSGYLKRLLEALNAPVVEQSPKLPLPVIERPIVTPPGLEETLPPPPTQIPEPPPKRKRGRPRKNQAKPSDNKPKRKPGRPRKVKIIDVD